MAIAPFTDEPGRFESQGLPKPERVVLDLEWLGDNRVRGRSGAHEIVMDSPPAVRPDIELTTSFELVPGLSCQV